LRGLRLHPPQPLTTPPPRAAIMTPCEPA
jgi:hypothetical protein